MTTVKIECSCGQRYEFDIEPLEGRMPDSRGDVEAERRNPGLWGFRKSVSRKTWAEQARGRICLLLGAFGDLSLHLHIL